jgi:hypothetical protein
LIFKLGIEGCDISGCRGDSSREFVDKRVQNIWQNIVVELLLGCVCFCGYLSMKISIFIQ